MKKTRLLLGCLAVLAILAGMTGCMLPDYQLTTDVTVTDADNTTGTYATITYNLTNTGSKSLDNVQVGIEIYRSTSVGYVYDTLGPFSIGTGSTTTGSVTYNFTAAPSGSYSFEVYVTSVGWDDN